MKAFRHGDWLFVPTQFRALKVANFGDPYDAIAVIDIADGTPHVQGLLSKDDSPFLRKDYRSFTDFFKAQDYPHYEYSRYQFGERKHVDKTL